jgi:hypothetical protein
MKEGYTHISVVLDSSGSMGSILDDTIGGFNTFLEGQQKAEGEATFSLAKFNQGRSRANPTYWANNFGEREFNQVGRPRPDINLVDDFIDVKSAKMLD